MDPGYIRPVGYWPTVRRLAQYMTAWRREFSWHFRQAVFGPGDRFIPLIDGLYGHIGQRDATLLEMVNRADEIHNLFIQWYEASIPAQLERFRTHRRELDAIQWLPFHHPGPEATAQVFLDLDLRLQQEISDFLQYWFPVPAQPIPGMAAFRAQHHRAPQPVQAAPPVPAGNPADVPIIDWFEQQIVDLEAFLQELEQQGQGPLRRDPQGPRLRPN